MAYLSSVFYGSCGKCAFAVGECNLDFYVGIRG